MGSVCVRSWGCRSAYSKTCAVRPRLLKIRKACVLSPSIGGCGTFSWMATRLQGLLTLSMEKLVIPFSRFRIFCMMSVSSEGR